MYCPNCGAKLPDKKSKFCPACGAPIIYKKKTNPFIDAIILGSIIILFIFAIIKTSKLLTEYRLSKLNETKVNIQTNIPKNPKKPKTPEVNAPEAPGRANYSSLKEPKFILLEKIKKALKGTNNEVNIKYNRVLNGYEIDVTIYKNSSFALNDYLNLIANIISISFNDSRNNVKFVICKVKDRDEIKLSVSLGAEAASKIPLYTFDTLSKNGLALIRWIKKNETSSSVGKLLMCRYYNNF